MAVLRASGAGPTWLVRGSVHLRPQLLVELPLCQRFRGEQPLHAHMRATMLAGLEAPADHPCAPATLCGGCREASGAPPATAAAAPPPGFRLRKRGPKQQPAGHPQHKAQEPRGKPAPSQSHILELHWICALKQQHAGGSAASSAATSSPLRAVHDWSSKTQTLWVPCSCRFFTVMPCSGRRLELPWRMLPTQ